MFKEAKSISIILTAMSAAFLLTACGANKDEKDPLRNYQVINTAVPPHSDQMKDQYKQGSIYDVYPMDNASFFLGEEKSVRIQVQLNFTNSSVAKYNLVLEDGPKGVLIRKGQAANQFLLTWKPEMNFLNGMESTATIPVILKLVPIKENNPAYDFMVSQIGTRTDAIILSVQKNLSIPVIDDKLVYSPAQTVNSDQNVKIRVQVEAAGLQNAKNLELNLVEGPDSPARELVQMNGKGAVLDSVRLVNSQTNPANGLVKNTYEINFDTQFFLEQILRKIEKDPALKKRFADGSMKEVEAQFDVYASNSFNAQKSAQKTINIKINLVAKAGDPLLLGKQSLSVGAGSNSSLHFFVKSSGGKGKVGAELVENKTEGLKSSLSCKTSSRLSNESLGCSNNTCLIECDLQVEAACAMKPQAIILKVNTISELGEEKLSKEYNFATQVTSSKLACPAVAQEAKAVQANQTKTEGASK